MSQPSALNDRIDELAPQLCLVVVPGLILVAVEREAFHKLFDFSGSGHVEVLSDEGTPIRRTRTDWQTASTLDGKLFGEVCVFFRTARDFDRVKIMPR